MSQDTVDPTKYVEKYMKGTFPIVMVPLDVTLIFASEQNWIPCHHSHDSWWFFLDQHWFRLLPPKLSVRPLLIAGKISATVDTLMRVPTFIANDDYATPLQLEKPFTWKKHGASFGYHEESKPTAAK